MALYAGLSTSLQALVSDSRRRHSDLRAAAERSYQLLQSIPEKSDRRVVLVLRERRDFLDPYLLVCSQKLVKYCAATISDLQRLSAAQALNVQALSSVVEALSEASVLGVDIQLKVLQVLPILFSEYMDSLSRVDVKKGLELCVFLVDSKSNLINNTAAAALRQILILIFDRAAKASDDGPQIDARDILLDLCSLAEDGTSRFLQFRSGMNKVMSLELLESVLSGHVDYISQSSVMLDLLRSHLLPLLSKLLSQKLDFPLTVRTCRLVFIVFQNYMYEMEDANEVLFTLLNHIFVADETYWKRCIYLEVLKILTSRLTFTATMLSIYDSSPDRKNLVADLLTSLNSLMTKNVVARPGKSTSNGANKSMRTTEAMMVEAGTAVSGLISMDFSSSPSDTLMTVENSSIRSMCIEQLDKTECPNLPSRYMWFLALSIVSNISDGLFLFILRAGPSLHPLTEKYGGGAMPPTPWEEPLQATFQEWSCWNNANIWQDDLSKQELAYSICDTTWESLIIAFNNVMAMPLGLGLYKSLAFSYGRMGEVCCVVGHVKASSVALGNLIRLATPSGADNTASLEASIEPRLMAVLPSESDSESVWCKNIVALQSVVTVAVHVGTFMAHSWEPLFRVIAQTHGFFGASSSGPRPRRLEKRTPSSTSNLAKGEQVVNEPAWKPELQSLTDAESRLFETTLYYSSRDLLPVIVAITSVTCKLIADSDDGLGTRDASNKQGTVFDLVANGYFDFSIDTPYRTAALFSYVNERLQRLCSLNSERLVLSSSDDSNWHVIQRYFAVVMKCSDLESEIRLQSCESLSTILISMSMYAKKDAKDVHEEFSSMVLQSLTEFTLHKLSTNSAQESTSKITDIEIAANGLSCLHSILEIMGDSITSGWNHCFFVLVSTCEENSNLTNVEKERRSRLVSLAFTSLQLLCSDFLGSLKPADIIGLLDVLTVFCQQQDNTNISLTSVGLFWNVLDGIRGQNDIDTADRRYESLDQLRDMMLQESEESYSDALWILALGTITRLCDQEFSRVSEPAARIIFRALEAQGYSLSSSTWDACIDLVVNPLLMRDTNTVIKKEELSVDAVTDGIAALMNNYVESLLKAGSFDNFWVIFTRYILALCQSDKLGQPSIKAVSTLRSCIKAILACRQAGRTTLDRLTSLHDSTWSTYQEIGKKCIKPALETGQDFLEAFLAGLDCFGQLFQMDGDSIESLLSILLDVLCYAESPYYALDVDFLSGVEKEFLNALNTVLDYETLHPSSVTCLAKSIALPYRQKSHGSKKESKRRGPTYIALSRASMRRAKTLFETRIGPDAVSPALSCAFARILESLALPIELKFDCPAPSRVGEAEPLWMTAVEAALAIFEKKALVRFDSLPRKSAEGETPSRASLVECLLRMYQGTTGLSRDFSPKYARQLEDTEEFDVAALRAIEEAFFHELRANGEWGCWYDAYLQIVSAGSCFYQRAASGTEDAGHAPDSAPVVTTAPLVLRTRRHMAHYFYECLFDTLRPDSMRHADDSASAAYAKDVVLGRMRQLLQFHVGNARLLGAIPAPYIERKELLLALDLFVTHRSSLPPDNQLRELGLAILGTASAPANPRLTRVLLAAIS